MKVRIIVDSTIDTVESVKSRLTIVPLAVRFGDEEYLDGVTIDHRRFYEKLIEGDVMPASSQPSSEAFEKPLLLGYTGLSDDMLRKYAADSARLWEKGGRVPRMTPVGSVVGTHAGPGAIAAAFFSKSC